MVKLANAYVWWRKQFTIIALFSLFGFQVSAQNQEQLWLEHQVSYPFGGRYLLENTSAYQTLLSSKSKWRSLSIDPAFEYSILTYLDLVSEVPIAYTVQKEGMNSFEIAPMVGGRFFITQNKRIDTRIVLRYQMRSFKQIEADDWDISNRTRLRGEIFACLNGPNMFTDNLLYTFADYEEYIVFDHQVDERYANRRRARVGVGYRLTYKHRFELSYTRQSSRNEIEENFISNDNVLQFKYKLFLNPTKPVTNDDN